MVYDRLLIKLHLHPAAMCFPQNKEGGSMVRILFKFHFVLLLSTAICQPDRNPIPVSLGTKRGKLMHYSKYARNALIKLLLISCSLNRLDGSTNAQMLLPTD